MKVYHPQIQVTLIKTSATPRVATIDLTPYMGEGGGVRTTKNVREPAGGFSITLADNVYTSKGDAKFSESLYALIEPMDMIEIRFCHDAVALTADSNTGKPKGIPPIIMRGFVSKIRRSQPMGQDGKPTRKVIVTGQDFGKVWQIMIIYYLQLAAAGDNTLTFMKWFTKYLQTDKMTTQLADSFLADVVNSALNPFLQGITATSKDNAITQGFKAYCSIEGSISPFSMTAFSDVSLHSMLATLLDVGAFNELFIEDNEKEISLILRPNPFMDLDGNAIGNRPALGWPGGTDAQIVIPLDDVQDIDSARSDEGVANWFWTANTKLVMVDDVVMMLLAQQSTGTLDYRQYKNSAESRFGFRKMHVEYKLGSNSEVPDSNTGTHSAINDNQLTPIEWAKAKRKLLADLNQDNVMFESGMMRLRGNEAIRAGRFVKLQQGGANESQFYVVSVDHDYMPYQGFFTTINYERGTGFNDRSKNLGQPYFKELDTGGIR